MNVLLHGDVLRTVFRYLDPETLARCLEVCRTWKNVLDYHDYLWAFLAAVSLRKNYAAAFQKSEEIHRRKLFYLLYTMQNGEKIKNMRIQLLKKRLFSSITSRIILHILSNVTDFIFPFGLFLFVVLLGIHVDNGRYNITVAFMPLYCISFVASVILAVRISLDYTDKIFILQFVSSKSLIVLMWDYDSSKSHLPLSHGIQSKWKRWNVIALIAWITGIVIYPYITMGWNWKTIISLISLFTILLYPISHGIMMFQEAISSNEDLLRSIGLGYTISSMGLLIMAILVFLQLVMKTLSTPLANVFSVFWAFLFCAMFAPLLLLLKKYLHERQLRRALRLQILKNRLIGYVVISSCASVFLTVASLMLFFYFDGKLTTLSKAAIPITLGLVTLTIIQVIRTMHSAQEEMFLPQVETSSAAID